ncbi:glucose dehydrogenase [FAD, quinone]-like [Eupeodes corollae]|uniref:glucose dehydrogenase [FAD, quinone]-like n=1 Tax=Eupeodes corollae TaxID=290404 RepID=UPI00249023C7|nr:glucose dehydrogenase [FAD, quinone]-like [Eupeodes corollae]
MPNFGKIKLRILLLTVLLYVSVGNAQIAEILAETLIFGLDAQDFISKELLPADLPAQNSSYDFIIVGAGPAGCVLANRLSENPNWTVYLLEAGGMENAAHDIPAAVSLLPRTNSNWGYYSVPQKNACKGMYDDVCALPRGKVLGGTSTINFMIYIRGNRIDYDRWAEAGNYGWSYDDVLPYFKRSEAANLIGLENSPYHNTTGPLSVEDVSYRTKIAEAFVEGSQQAGHKLNDYNGESQLGTSYVQATTKRGHRHTASKAYLYPIKNKRRNLHILTFATVTRVLIDPKTNSTYGVEFVYKGKTYTIRAKKEVILSAGAFNSPQLLMLSGIGPRDVLTSVGIPIIKELPVGKIMYDHMSFAGPVVLVNTTGQTLFADRLGPIDFLRFETGDPSTRFSTIGGVEALTIIKTPNSNQPAKMPDVEIIMVSASFASDYNTGLSPSANFRDIYYNEMFKQLRGRDHFSGLIFHYHPESFGFLTLKNRDPLTPPIIDPNYYFKEQDIEFVLEGVKEFIRIINTPAMQRIGARLFDVPTIGCEQHEFGSDDYWRCCIRIFSYTLHHQVATCKMGPSSDPTTVVDPQLKVHGIRKLRVADTSPIPTLPSAHVNAPSFMIGEKAADMIIAEWQK